MAGVFLVLGTLILPACGVRSGEPTPAPPAPSPVPPAPDPTPAPAPPAARAADYFPAGLGWEWDYAGDGNEYAAFTRKVEHRRGNLVQVADDNGGTVSGVVVRVEADRVTRLLRRGEHYDGSSLLDAAPATGGEVLIQAPLAVGTSWAVPDGGERTIVAVDEKVTVPAGTLDHVLRTRTIWANSTSVVEASYARGVGLVKTEFRDPAADAVVRSELRRFHGGDRALPENAVSSSQDAGAPGAEPSLTTPVAAPAPVTPRVTLTTAAVAQGGLAAVAVDGLPATAAAPTVSAGDLPAPRFVRSGDRWLAVLGVPAGATPGPRRLAIRWPGGDWQGEVTVTAREFAREDIPMAPETSNLLDDPRIAEQVRLQQRLRLQGPVPPAWDGPFLVPVTGTISSAFGETRFANGRPLGQHTGVDFDVPAGTPVQAAAAGRVVLARELVITGSTVMLEHGAGLFTQYAHLSTLEVEEGQVVTPGQIVGLVGSTGLATGPHLHWGLYVGDTPIDPHALVGNLPPLFAPS